MSQMKIESHKLRVRNPGVLDTFLLLLTKITVISPPLHLPKVHCPVIEQEKDHNHHNKKAPDTLKFWEEICLLKHRSPMNK